MAIERWRPSQATTRREEFLLSRLRRTRKLFAFLRDHRADLFPDEFQAELETMYRDTGAGKEPGAPRVYGVWSSWSSRSSTDQVRPCGRRGQP